MRPQDKEVAASAHEAAASLSGPEENDIGALDGSLKGGSGVAANATVRSLTRQNPPRNSSTTAASAAAAAAALTAEEGDEASALALKHFLIGHGDQYEEEDESTSFLRGKPIMMGSAENVPNNVETKLAGKKPKQQGRAGNDLPSMAPSKRHSASDSMGGGPSEGVGLAEVGLDRCLLWSGGLTASSIVLSSAYSIQKPCNVPVPPRLKCTHLPHLSVFFPVSMRYRKTLLLTIPTPRRSGIAPRYMHAHMMGRHTLNCVCLRWSAIKVV